MREGCSRFPRHDSAAPEVGAEERVVGGCWCRARDAMGAMDVEDVRDAMDVMGSMDVIDVISVS